jgi:peptidyl-prolyl cis-trans isomerase D
LLKWSLAIVCLAFVIFYIPDFLRGTGAAGAAGATDTIATVNGEEIRAEEFRQAYQAQLLKYRSLYGAGVSEQLLKQTGIEQQLIEEILRQLVDERAAIAEADRLKIKVTDAEVINRIAMMQEFQQNGAFIGEDRYRQLLASSAPPLTPAEFEDRIRGALKIDKLRAAITGWMSIGDKELEQEYRLRNEKVKLAVISVTADSVRASINVPDADVTAHFDSHKEDFKIPEKRKIRYLLVDLDATRSKIVVPQADIERAYNDGIEQYTTPEQVRASHVLLKIGAGKDEAAVKATAEDVLKQAKSGADFAALAKKYSEDETTAAKGGDLDFFGRGRMVPEFDSAAFTMEPGQISDLVKTQYGFHIIKLVEKKVGTTKPLTEVKDQISDQLAFQRAQTQAAELGDKLAAKITKSADLDTQAAANGLQVQESGFFARDEPILGLGASPEVSARAFDLKDGETSGQLRTSRGVVFFAPAGKQDAYVPKLDEVKEKVRETLIKQRAREVATQKATELAAKLKGGDFEKAAKAAGLDVKTTEFLTKDSEIPELGPAPGVMDKAFTMTQGAVSDPIQTENGAAIVKVIEKEGITPEDIAAHKDEFREQLLNDRRGRFFSAYMTKARERVKIEINREAVQRTVG